MSSLFPRAFNFYWFLLIFILGVALQTRLTFFHCKKDPAGRLAKRLAPREAIKFIFIRAFYNLSFLGRRPKPALLFLIAEKEGKKASPLGTYKTYFEPGVLQLPTVGQIKRLYNSVQNRFYKQVQKGAFNDAATAKAKRKTALCFVPCRAVQEIVFIA